MKQSWTAIGGAQVLLVLTACGGVDVENQSSGVPASIAASTASTSVTASTSGSSSTSTIAAIPNRSGAQQQRECLHCAP